MIQNPFLTAQSTQIKSVISVPIKDFIHHYPRALLNDIPRVGAHFYDIPGSGECYEEEVQPYRKTDYKPIIYREQRAMEVNVHVAGHRYVQESLSKSIL